MGKLLVPGCQEAAWGGNRCPVFAEGSQDLAQPGEGEGGAAGATAATLKLN